MNKQTNNTTATTTTIIKILIVSDIHLSFTNINQLGNKLKQDNIDIDLVVCPGDVCNFDPINENDEKLVSECQQEMIKIYESLQSIVKPDTKIIYLPGNHDSKHTIHFGNQHSPKLTENSFNIHKSQYRLHDDLIIVGVGGSLPSYRDNEKHWTGYPYDNEDQVLMDLKKSFSDFKIIGNNNNDNNSNNTTTNATLAPTPLSKDKIILLTHMGPWSSSTTIDQIDLKNSPIYSGSKSIEKILKENQESIILNLHGHTHHSTGMSKIGNTKIINPGSLRAGNFAIVTIEKFLNQLWRIKSSEFIKL